MTDGHLASLGAWPTVSFEQVVEDCTGGQPKIQRRDYQRNGRIPVVDQGQTEIAGFTNDDDYTYRGTLPVILFGDHTRVFKFVDFPFALGADGVKVLKSRIGFDAKFLFYYLSFVRLPDLGYSRHFKHLREVRIPLVPPSEQTVIVRILDKAHALRRKRAEANAKAQRILPALFFKMFGDPALNPRGWPLKPFDEVFDDRTAQFPKLQKNEYKKIGRFPVVDQSKSAVAGYYDDDSFVVSLDQPVVVFGDHTRIVKYVDFPFIAGADGSRVFVAKEGFIPAFLAAQLELQPIPNLGYSRHMRELRRMQFIAPARDLQVRFADLAMKFAPVLRGQARVSSRVEDIWQSLLRRSFSGGLTAKWREAHAAELLHESEEQARALGITRPKTSPTRCRGTMKSAVSC
jgi:type I restriction enzyme S subunit